MSVRTATLRTSPGLRSIWFFFQAEDGIRDHCVTGVQTCALPISDQTRKRHRSRNGDPRSGLAPHARHRDSRKVELSGAGAIQADRKSTRLNSSHTVISYAVFCLKKKKQNTLLSRCTRSGYRT